MSVKSNNGGNSLVIPEVVKTLNIQYLDFFFLQMSCVASPTLKKEDDEFDTHLHKF